MIHCNKINLDIKIILKSKKYITLDIIGSDLKVVMIHMMYVWSLDHPNACLIVNIDMKIYFYDMKYMVCFI